jgi:hypothetical protein
VVNSFEIELEQQDAYFDNFVYEGSTANQPPVAADDSATTTADTAVVINVVANDTDSDGTIDPATVQVTAAPANGTVVANTDGTVTYTPASGFTGTDTFKYTVSDNEGAVSNEATVTVTVNAVSNTPPVLNIIEPDGIADELTEGSSYNITYTLDDPDDVVTVALYYDTDNSGLDGTAIGGCASEPEGTGLSCTWDTTGVTPGSYYIYGITSDGVNPSVSAYSSGQVTINASGTSLFSDDFSTDTTGDYTVVDTWTQGGTGQFLYDSAGQRLNVLTGDNIGLMFSHTLPSLDTGTFSFDFLPTVKYPYGGWLHIRLKQDDNNYYEIDNTDGYGPKWAQKVVNGVVVETVDFQSEYSQNNNYHIVIDFSPGRTTVSAFGETLTLSTDSNPIVVNSFEIELEQQDAYFDNFVYEGL